MKEDVTVPESTCPECGYISDRVTAIGDAPAPKPGDLSLCIKCACLAAFTDDLTLRPANDDELFWAATDRLTQDARAAILKVQSRS
jgi:hypothetical protein